MESGRCTFCGARVDAATDYRRVTGWERHRSQGGTNAIRLREVHPEWACAACVSKQARGVAVEQISLI